MPRGVYDRGKRLDKANKRALADGYVSHVTAIVEGESTARDTNPAPGPGRVEVSAPPRCDACHWWERDAALLGDSLMRMGNCFCEPRIERRRDDQRCRWFQSREEGARS